MNRTLVYLASPYTDPSIMLRAGRCFTGIERDKRFVDITTERLRMETDDRSSVGGK